MGGHGLKRRRGSGAYTTSHTVTGLSNGQRYTFYLRAVNEAGEGSSRSVTGRLMWRPGAPAGLTATAGDRQVALTWEAGTGNWPAISKYQYRQSTDGGRSWSPNWRDITGTTGTTLTGLINGVAYTFQVRGVNGEGAGVESVLVSATPLDQPEAPTGLTAVASVGEVGLSWDDPGDASITKYQVQVYGSGGSGEWEDMAGSGAYTTSHTVTGLTNGQRYRFYLRAVNEAGEGSSRSVTGRLMWRPGAPAGLTATAGDRQVALTWEAGTGNWPAISKYQYRQSTDGGRSWSPNWRDITGTTGTTLTGLINGVAYTFQVRGVNGEGAGVESVLVSATPLDQPEAPTGLTAVASVGEVGLSWDDPGNASITKYQVQVYGSGGSGEWEDMAGSGAYTTSHTVTGLTNGQRYRFYLRAVNEAGEGSSRSVTGRLMWRPGAPAGLTATAGDRQVALTWEAGTGNWPAISKYQYRQSTDGGRSWSPNWRDITGTTGTTLTGLINGVAYTYQVRGVNGEGAGVESVLVSATPLDQPEAPTGLTAVASVGEVGLSWDDPGNASITKYQLLVSGSGGSDEWEDMAGSGAYTTSHTVTGLTNGQGYRFYLRAVNEAGEGSSRSVTGRLMWRPGAPAGLTAAAGDRLVALTWEVGTDNWPAISRYQYRQSTDGGTSWSPNWRDIAGSGASTTGTTLGSLTNGVAYTFQVRGVNGEGAGVESVLVSATPRGRPDAPTGLTASASDGEVRLSWDDPGDPSITKYQLRVNGSGASNEWEDMAGSGAYTTSHAVTGLTNGQTYTFYLRAVNEAGEGSYARFSAAPQGRPGAPGAPTGLAAELGDGEARLSWDDPGDGSITKYQVQVSGSGASNAWEDVAGSGATTTSHTETGLTNGVGYRFYVRAVNEAGEGSSRSVYARLVWAPGAPAGLTATAGDGRVALRWEAGADNWSAITSYEYRWSTDGGTSWDQDWTNVYNSDVATRSRTVSGLTNGVAYTFQVRAVNGEGVGDASVPASATPQGWPGAPTGLAAELGDGEVRLSWDDPGDGSITKYQVQVSGSGASNAWEDVAGSGATTTSHTETGLTNGVGYRFYVRAVNEAGEGSSRSVYARLVWAPGAPAGLTATAGDGRVALRWEAGADNWSAITSYEYRWSTDGGTSWDQDWTNIYKSDVATRSRTVRGLTNGVAYTFQVRAVNGEGVGDASVPASATPQGRPGAPTGLAAELGDGEARLSWDDPGDGSITKYQVWVSGSGASNAWEDVAGSGATTTSHTETGLTNGVGYRFYVRAVNEAGEGSSRSVYARLVWAPGAPAGLTATAGDGRVALRWEAGADNWSAITSYEYRWSTDGGTSWDQDWTNIYKSDVATRSRTVSGLTNGVAYTFQVRAVNGEGVGDASAPVSATPQGRPGAPTGLAAELGDGEVRLSWDDPGDGSITKYQVWVSGSGASNEWEDVAGSGATTTSHTETGLTNGVGYRFYVRAVNEAGEGSSRSVYARLVWAPGAPAGLTATAGDGRVALRWEAGADNWSAITSYEYRWSTDGGTSWDQDWTNIYKSSAVTRSRTVSGLSNGVAYTFQVRAVNGEGVGDASVPASATPQGRPGAPTGLAAELGDGEVRLSWDDPGDGSITKYQVWVSGSGASNLSEDVAGSSSSTTSHTVTGLTNGAGYTFYVRAVNEAGEGSYRSVYAELVWAPGAPAGLTATAGDRQVALRWEAGADNWSAITRYEYRWSTDGGTSWDQDWTNIYKSSAATRSRTVRGLSNGVAYTFQVRAVNGEGVGEASALVSATPQDRPGAPTGLAAELGDGEVRLSWDDPGDGSITKYQVRVDGSGSNEWEDMAGSGATTTSHTVNGLANGGEYTFQIRAVNGQGVGDASALVSAASLSRPGALAGLAAAAAEGEVRLSWDDPGNASITKYQMRQGQPRWFQPWSGWTDIAGSGAATTSHTVSGLANGGEYTFQIRAVNDSGEGPESASTTGRLLWRPGAPTSLRAAVVRDGQVELTWEAGSDNWSGIIKYQYRQSVDGGTSWLPEWADIAGSSAATRSLTLWGLTNGQAYTFQIRAVNGEGVGDASALASATPLGRPGAPAGLVAAAAEGEVRLSWDDPGNASITKYQIRQGQPRWFQPWSGWTDMAGSGASTTSHTVTGLANGGEYTFQIRAVNDSGEGPESGSATGRLLWRPGAPTGLRAEVRDGQVELTWEAGPDKWSGIIKYQYRQSVDGGTSWLPEWVDIAGSNAATRSLTLWGLTNGQAYTFQIRAVNGEGVGDASALASATPLGRPGAPAGLAAAAAEGEVRLSWDDPGNASITKYQIRQGQPIWFQPWSGWTDIAGSGASTTSHTVSGLANGGEHTFQIRAVNDSGEGPESGSVTGRLLWRPGAPVGLTAEVRDGQVELTWEAGPDNWSGIIKYQYRQSTDGGTSWLPEWVDIAGSSAATRSLTLWGLTNGQAYTFQIRAVNGEGVGDASALASATPLGRPGAPAGLVAAAAEGEVRLSWDDPGNTSITKYQIRRGQPRWFQPWSQWTDIAGSGATTTSHMVSGLDNGGEYTFQIRAVNDSGEGPESGSVTGRLLWRPGAPVGLTAAVRDGQVELSWEAGPDKWSGIIKYRYRQSTDGGTSWDQDWSNIYQSSAATRSLTLWGLTNGQVYTFQIRAVNGEGEGDASALVSATPLGRPGAPAGPAAVAAEGEVRLSWDDPGNASITKYQIRQKRVGWFQLWSRWVNVAGSGAATTSHTVTGLANGGEYTFQIRAVNDSGEGPGSASVTASPMGPPSAVEGLAARAGAGQVVLAWVDPDDAHIIKYQYRQSTDGGTSWLPEWTDMSGSGATTTSHTVTGLTNGTEYTFEVRAVNGEGAGVGSVSVTATPVPPLGVPTGFTVAVGDGQVTLSWDDPGNTGITKYQVRHNSGSWWRVLLTGWTEMAGSGATTTSHTVTGLSNGIAYTFQIRAANDGRKGDGSGLVTVRLGPPGAPAGLAAVADNGRVSLSWAVGLDNVEAISSYQYRSSSDGGSTWDPEWTDIAGSGATTASHTVTGLTNGTEHTFEVRAVNGAGTGASASVAATPLVIDPPGAPAGLAAVAGNGRVALGWTDPEDVSISRYQYRRSSDGGGTWDPEWTDISGSGAATAGHTVIGLLNGTEYTFEVRAVNGAGAGASASVTAAPLVVAPPDAPAGLAATAGATLVALEWTDPEEASISRYQYRRSSDGGGTWDPEWTDISGSSATTASHTVTGLVNGTEYTFQVRAVNSCGRWSILGHGDVDAGRGGGRAGTADAVSRGNPSDDGGREAARDLYGQPHWSGDV